MSATGYSCVNPVRSNGDLPRNYFRSHLTLRNHVRDILCQVMSDTCQEQVGKFLAGSEV